jgi:hypothetical protein
MKRTTIANQRGAVLIIFALVLLVLIGFTALAMEAGRWYMVRAELSKSVDAAALAGAKNISNPFVDPLVLAQEFGQANFPTGYGGTPVMGTTGAVTFNASPLSEQRIQVTGSVSALAYLAQLFGVNQVSTTATGAAQKKKVEIMMVLDRTGSMNYSGKMYALKSAAGTFVDHFQDTQADDKMGLISFAVSVKVDRPLGTNYVNEMKSAISRMSPQGATNMEDAIDQADGPQGFTDQSGVPGDERLQQFLIFFSDGMPTAFRGTFRGTSYSGENRVYDGVAYISANIGYNNAMNCRPAPGEEAVMYVDLNRPDMEVSEGSWLGISATPTGDGLPKSVSACGAGRSTTKWDMYNPPGSPVPGFGPDTCYIPTANVILHTCTLARNLTLYQAQVLKDKGIKIYVIGLGSGDEIDADFLRQISSGDRFVYITPNAGDLQSIFNAVAKDIKLRLVK